MEKKDLISKYNILFTRKEMARVYKAVEVLGSKDMSSIIFYNENMKRVGCYIAMVTHPVEISDSLTIAYLKKHIRLNKEIEFINLIKN